MSWFVAKNTNIPAIPEQLPLDKVRTVLRASANASGNGSMLEYVPCTLGRIAPTKRPTSAFEQRQVERPLGGTAFIARIDSGDPAQGLGDDGWAWTDQETLTPHPMPDGSRLHEWTRMASKDAAVVRKRYSLSTAPLIHLVHYISAENMAAKVKTDSLKTSNAKGSDHVSKKQKKSDDGEYWGFEDQSIPTLVCLARYKRNHDLMQELLTPGPLAAPKEKFESKTTVEDIRRLEAEIHALEEQNKKLLNTASDLFALPTPTSPLQSPSMLSSPPHVSTLTLDVNVKETREANVTGAMLNGQFVLGKVLGRGSFGTVHEATDIVANRTVAIKEMDAKKLRRTKALASFKPGNGTGGMPMRGGGVFRGAVGRRPPPGSTPPITTPPIVQDTPKQDPIDLVRGEIAIMKKLQHPNIVRLYEVLHDPSQEVIYMVYELMEKGVIMDIGMDTTAEAFPEEKARFYFRQIILAIEYLHEHDIAHRDIKPDNLLVSKDNILKVVDFGVSEIFGTQGNDKSNKSEGSPAFFSPELCMPNHGNISARAVDVWAIGVTLYCLVTGHLPFTGNSIINLYEEVKNSSPDLSSPTMSPELVDLLSHLLDKNPTTRITVDKIRNHPWLTVNGKEPLLPSKSENCRKMVTEITSEDMAAAVSTFNPVWTVMRAVQKFKTRLTPTGSRAGSKDELAGSVSSSSQLAGSLTTSQRSLSRESFVGQASSLVGSLLSLSGMSRSVSTGNGMEGSSASSGGIKTAPGETVGDVMNIDKTIDSLATSKSTPQ
ncbi:hypothetical protein HDU77_000526 [Chytriomyces hyalinus]|nr:hypothetical protein HDU77_000526 [Chytriomyces hyalinus]